MRMKNAILCLAQYKMMLFDTSVLYAYEASSQFQVRLHVFIIVTIGFYYIHSLIMVNLPFSDVFIHFNEDGEHIIKNHHCSFGMATGQHN